MKWWYISTFIVNVLWMGFGIWFGRILKRSHPFKFILFKYPLYLSCNRRRDPCSPASTSLETTICWRSWDSPPIPVSSRLTWRSCLPASTAWSLMTMPSTSWPWSHWMGRWCHCSAKSRSCPKWRFVEDCQIQEWKTKIFPTAMHLLKNVLWNRLICWVHVIW